MSQPKRTQTKMDLLTHLERHGRADPTTLGGLYFPHIRSQRDKDSDAAVRRQHARHALQRMARYGLVRLLASGDAKITAAGRRHLEAGQADE